MNSRVFFKFKKTECVSYSEMNNNRILLKTYFAERLTQFGTLVSKVRVSISS